MRINLITNDQSRLLVDRTEAQTRRRPPHQGDVDPDACLTDIGRNDLTALRIALAGRNLYLGSGNPALTIRLARGDYGPHIVDRERAVLRDVQL